jgi:hypothetical protein
MNNNNDDVEHYVKDVDINSGISFSFDDTIPETDEDIDLSEMLKEFHSKECAPILDNSDILLKYSNGLYDYENLDLNMCNIVNYNCNFNVKQLMKICDYYGLAKSLKTNKCNKEEIINILVDFENNPINSEIIERRKMMWYYVNQLREDKFMKKFVIWD